MATASFSITSILPTCCCSVAIWLARFLVPAGKAAISCAVPKAAPADGGAQRAHDQGEDQQLLAPLAAEHPPGPADHGAAGGNAPVRRPRRGRPFAQRGVSLA